MSLGTEERKQAILGRRVPVIWKNLRCLCVAVIGDVATIIWKPGEEFERVPLADIREAKPGDEYIDHCDRIIVVKPEPELDPAWTEDGLRRGPWTAYVEGSREEPGGWPIDPPDPTCWRAFAGTYMVSDRDVVSNSDGSSKTFIIYLQPEEYVRRLAQRALALWIPETTDKVEREKDARIRRLLSNVERLQEENERLWARLGAKLEARS